MKIPPVRTETSSMPDLQWELASIFFRLKERVWRRMTNWTFRSSSKARENIATCVWCGDAWSGTVA